MIAFRTVGDASLERPCKTSYHGDISVAAEVCGYYRRVTMANTSEPNLARMAGMIGEPARAAMLAALLGGEWLSAGELARCMLVDSGSLPVQTPESRT